MVCPSLSALGYERQSTQPVKQFTRFTRWRNYCQYVLIKYPRQGGGDGYCTACWIVFPLEEPINCVARGIADSHIALQPDLGESGEP